MMFSRAWIHVEEWTGLNGNQATAGKLTVEIERQSLKYFLPNFKSVLEAGGFSENFPIVDVNKALVAQKVWLNGTIARPKKFLKNPGYKFEKSNKSISA